VIRHGRRRITLWYLARVRARLVVLERRQAELLDVRGQTVEIAAQLLREHGLSDELGRRMAAASRRGRHRAPAADRPAVSDAPDPGPSPVVPGPRPEVLSFPGSATQARLGDRLGGRGRRSQGGAGTSSPP
jgi:hypothetical protein